MTFQPGNTYGNRKGRPKKGDSLAEAVRAGFDRPTRLAAVKAIAAKAMAGNETAFDVLARRGWPDEAKGELTINAPDATSVQIVHKHVTE